jgi:hypothetical protein
MLDLEAWDERPTAVVRALALLEFCPLEGRIGRRSLIDLRPTLDEQLEIGRTVSEAARAWWREQERATGRTLSRMLQPYQPLPWYRRADFLDQALAVVAAWPAGAGSRVWCRWHYDLPVLCDLFAGSARRLPWGFRQWRDAGTLDEYADRVRPKAPHDPVADAEAQIEQLVESFRIHRAGRAALAGAVPPPPALATAQEAP